MYKSVHWPDATQMFRTMHSYIIRQPLIIIPADYISVRFMFK